MKQIKQFLCCCFNDERQKIQERYQADKNSYQQTQLLKQIKQKIRRLQNLIKEIQDMRQLFIFNNTLNQCMAQSYLEVQQKQELANIYILRVVGKQFLQKKLFVYIKVLEHRKFQLQSLIISVRAFYGLSLNQNNLQINQKLKTMNFQKPKILQQRQIIYANTNRLFPYHSPQIQIHLIEQIKLKIQRIQRLIEEFTQNLLLQIQYIGFVKIEAQYHLESQQMQELKDIYILKVVRQQIIIKKLGLYLKVLEHRKIQLYSLEITVKVFSQLSLSQNNQQVFQQINQKLKTMEFQKQQTIQLPRIIDSTINSLVQNYDIQIDFKNAKKRLQEQLENKKNKIIMKRI